MRNSSDTLAKMNEILGARGNNPSGSNFVSGNAKVDRRTRDTLARMEAITNAGYDERNITRVPTLRQTPTTQTTAPAVEQNASDTIKSIGNLFVGQNKAPTQSQSISTNSDIVREYESIPDYNYFQRAGKDFQSRQNKAAYDRKQELSGQYKQAKAEETARRIQESGITLDEIKAALNISNNPGELLTAEQNAQRMANQQATLKKLEAIGVSGEDAYDYYQKNYGRPELEKEIQKDAEAHPALSTLGSFLTNMVEGTTDAIGNAANYLRGRAIENREDETTQKTREAVRNTLDTNFGKTAYDVATSVGDTATAALTGALTGGGSLAVGGLQGLGKANQVMQEGAERNLTPDQIAAEGALSFATTAATEGLSYGRISEIAEKGITKLSAKEIGKALGAQMATEGFQEVAEELADYVADGLVAQDQNKVKQSIDNYVAQGMSKTDATKRAVVDIGKTLAMDFIGGAAGGLVLGGGMNLAQAAAGNYIQNHVPALYDNVDTMSGNNVTEQAEQQTQQATQRIEELRQQIPEQVETQEQVAEQTTGQDDFIGYGDGSPEMTIDEAMSSVTPVEDLVDDNAEGGYSQEEIDKMEGEAKYKGLKGVNQRSITSMLRDKGINAGSPIYNAYRNACNLLVAYSKDGNYEHINEARQIIQYANDQMAGSKGRVKGGKGHEFTFDEDWLTSKFEGLISQTIGNHSAKIENEMFVTPEGKAGLEYLRQYEDALNTPGVSSVKGLMEAIYNSVYKTGNTELDTYKFNQVFDQAKKILNNLSGTAQAMNPGLTESGLREAMQNVTKDFWDYGARQEVKQNAKPQVMAEDTGLNDNDRLTEFVEQEQTAQEQAPADDIELVMGKQSSGTRESKYTYKTLVNTPFVKDVKQNAENVDAMRREGVGDYDIIGEVQSVDQAVENLQEKGFEAEKQRIEEQPGVLSGVDMDEGMIILDNLFSKAAETGIYNEVKNFVKVMRQHATRAGQAIQALAKYSRTAPGALASTEHLRQNAINDFENREPGVKQQVEKTSEDLWNDLVQGQEELQRKVAEGTAENNGTATPKDLENTVKAAIKKNGMEQFFDTDSEQGLVNFIENHSDSQKDIYDGIMAFLATGFFEVSDADMEQVQNLYNEAQQYGENSKSRYDLQEKAYKILAKYLPRATMKQKMDAWRYMAMLTNPRTHIRNILGNVIFGKVVTGIKDNIAAGIESGLSAMGMNIDRTKSFINYLNEGDKALVDRSLRDAPDQYALFDTGNKLNDVSSGIERNQRIFENQKLDKVREVSGHTLSEEDWIAQKSKYGRALAGFLKANGKDTSIFESAEHNADDARLLNKARKYAIEQANIATFHEYNKFAQQLTRFSRELSQSNNVASQGFGMLIDAEAPFKNTPANILKQGIQYSPVSLLEGLWELRGLKKGTKSPSQVIDTFSKGLTGSGIMLLGAWLRSLGVLSGSSDDDDELDELQGKQNYAINIGDSSYTIDWLVPSMLPLAVGGELYDAVERRLNGESVSIVDFANAFAGLMDPIVETSMLSGIDDMLHSVSYADNKLGTIVASAATNYISQFVPTLFGQVARAVDDTRRTAYDPAKGAVGEFTYTGRSLMNRIPGLSMLNPASIDAYGREQENFGGNFAGRLAYNMLSPGYVSTKSKDEITDELTRLHEAGMQNGNEWGSQVIPQSASTNPMNEGRISSRDYENYSKTLGSLNYDLIEEFMSSSLYDDLVDEERATIIGDLQGFAKAEAKAELFDYDIESATDYSKAHKIYEEQGASAVMNYYAIKHNKDGNGNAAVIGAIDTQNLSDEDKGYFTSIMVSSVSGDAQKAADRLGEAGYYYWYSMASSADGTSKQAKIDRTNQMYQAGEIPLRAYYTLLDIIDPADDKEKKDSSSNNNRVPGIY